MKREISLEALTLADIQPSQFYISGEKLRRVLTWFDPANLRNFEPCPVYEFQGKAVFTDGHTRAFAMRPTGVCWNDSMGERRLSVFCQAVTSRKNGRGNSEQYLPEMTGQR